MDMYHQLVLKVRVRPGLVKGRPEEAVGPEKLNSQKIGR